MTKSNAKFDFSKLPQSFVQSKRGNKGGQESSDPTSISPIVTEPIRPNYEKRALDLFSGTGSVGQRLREWGSEVTSLDISKSSGADICTSILTWQYRKQFPPGYFEVIAAGVPGDQYSAAHTVGPRNLVLADRIVKRTFYIIHYFNPKLCGLKIRGPVC